MSEQEKPEEKNEGMPIQTRFVCDEPVFYLLLWFNYTNGVYNKQFKICEGVIDSIKIGVTPGKTDIGYYLKPGAMYMPEDSIFKTKLDAQARYVEIFNKVWEDANPLRPMPTVEARKVEI